MTDIQLPVPVTHLFALFGITEPARMLIILLGLGSISIISFIMLIAFFVASHPAVTHLTRIERLLTYLELKNLRQNLSFRDHSA